MAIANHARRTLRIEQATLVSDGAGGQDSTWSGVGSVKAWIHVVDSEGQAALGNQAPYGRETLVNMVMIQCDNVLGKRINGKRTLYDAMIESGVERFRFVYQGRTFHPTEILQSGAGYAGPNQVRIACEETIQPVGYFDQ